MSTSVPRKHRGPSEAILATIHLVVFMGGVIVASRRAHQTYVSPFMSDDTIVEFFRLHHDAVLMQAFAVFASAIPLGVYAATAVSRLNFLGVRVAGVTISEFGGFGTSFMLALSGMTQWVLSQHNIGASAPTILSWQGLAFMTGGPGYASLLGLFIAGVSVPSFFMRLLPRWLCVWGVVIGLVGQLSIRSLLLPSGFTSSL